MKTIIIFLCLFIGHFQELNAQNNQIWSHKIFDYTITFNFEKEQFKVDTIDSYEGYVFYFKFVSDSSYFRMNYISPNAKFECCTNDTIYKVLNKKINGKIIDTNGKIGMSNLRWRVIKNEDIEIVYNNCSERMLNLFNEIMNSVYKKFTCKY